MKKIYILFLGICMGVSPLWAMEAPAGGEMRKFALSDEEMFNVLERIRVVTMLGAASTSNQELADELYSKGIDAALLIDDDIRFGAKQFQVEVSNLKITEVLNSLDPSIKEFIEKFIRDHKQVLGNNELWERLIIKHDLMLLSDSSLDDSYVSIYEDTWLKSADLTDDERVAYQKKYSRSDSEKISVNKLRETLKISVNKLRETLGNYLKDLSKVPRYRRCHIGAPYILNTAVVDHATRARVNQELRLYLRVLASRYRLGVMDKELNAILKTPVDELAKEFHIIGYELEMFQLPVPVVRDVVREEISPTTVGEKAGFSVHLATPRAKIMGLMGIVGAVMLIARKKVKQYTPSLKGIASVPKRYPYISALVVAGLVATAGVGAGKYKRSREQE